MGDESSLSDFVRFEQRGAKAVLTLDRPAKRNALDPPTVRTLGSFFANPPAEVAAAVLRSSSENVSAGLDLSELTQTSVFDSVLHSRGWPEPLNQIQLGTVPVVSVSRGAVVGGGLELLVGDGEGFDKAFELANRIAQNTPVTNDAVIQALPRIAEMGPGEGLFVESLMAAISQGSDKAKALLDELLSDRAAQVAPDVASVEATDERGS